jgi:hypothetical protein
MPFAEATPQEQFSLAVERMAVRALDALSAVGGADAAPPPIAPLGGSTADLAAVRILGADLFTPYLLTGAPLHPELAEAVALADAFRAFPPEELALHGAPGQPASVVGWRDGASAELLVRCGLPVDAPAPTDAAGRANAGSGSEPRWQEWSLWMAKLSPLALPGLDSAVHESARLGMRALARGTVRAMLRRDYRTAARIARWLALGQSDGLQSPVQLPPLLRHIRLFGGPGARTALDVRVGERLAEAVGR